MNRARPFINRFVKQKEQQLQDTYHSVNLKEIKPMNSRFMDQAEPIVLNRRKNEMIKQVREIEIDRENKFLMEKIATVMIKKGAYSPAKNKHFRAKVNKSLNQIYRKRQLQNIQLQNRRFLKRLRNKRPTLNTQKLNKDWIQNKDKMRRMANVNFHITNLKYNLNRIKSIKSEKYTKQRYEKMKLLRLKKFNDEIMLIKIEFADGMLKIVGDLQGRNDIKIIEIPKDQAIVFLQKDCQGRFQLLLQKLQYDALSDVLYLVSQNLIEEDAELNDFNPQSALVDWLKIRLSVQNGNGAIKQVTNQSLEFPAEKVKISNIVQVKVIENQSSQSQHVQKSRVVKMEHEGKNQFSFQQKVQQAQQKEKLQKIQQSIPKPNLEEREEQKHKKDEIPSQKAENMQNQEAKHKEPVLASANKLFQQDQAGQTPKKELEQTRDKQIFVEPESLEDYNQQLQLNKPPKISDEIDEVKTKTT